MKIRGKSPHADSHPRSVESSHEAGRQSVAEKAQALDEQSVAASGDSVVDRYRFIYHAVRAAPLPEPPATFALQMERLTRDQPEQASPETWMLRSIAGAFALIVVAFGLPATAAMPPRWLEALAPLPWPLLLAIGSGLSMAWLADRMIGRACGAAASTDTEPGL
jgi:hypothetical protein